MGGIKTLILLHLVYLSTCMDQLHIVYEWKQLDYQFESAQARQEALDSKRWIPENNLPMGVEVYKDRLFVTVPRWRPGVAATLNYINLKDNSTKSPVLIPYPNWAAHSFNGDSPPEIISPFRVRADRCGRLWVLDSGLNNSENKTYTKKSTPSIIVYDLNNDNLIRRFNFPADQVKEDSGFANIALEDSDCEKTYAYAADLGKAGLVVYSWEKNESWRVSHHYFYQDPLACDFSVKGYNFTWTDALFGIGLSAPGSDNFPTLYFHPMASNKEFSVSTEYLRNQTVADNNFDAFKNLGDRGPNAQSGVSFIHPKTGVLFYSLINLNAVACWKTSNKEYTMKNQGRIYMNENTMVYPTDIKVDYDDNLWILSNRMPIWRYGKLDSNDVNFRVFSAPVVDAISHTACDITPRTDILDKFLKSNSNRSMPGEITARTLQESAASSLNADFAAIFLLCWIISFDNSTKSPALIPFPNWAAHSFDGDSPPEIIAPFRVRADRCGRLWVLDSGKVNNAENETDTKKFTPSIIIYDLSNDNLIRRFNFPADHVKEDSQFANIALEDSDCEKTYAYAADLGKAGLVVYSWEKNESWRISHHYFYQDPLACDFNVKGHNFTWTDALFGIGLSAPGSDNFPTLYFHPMASTKEFSVSTEYLRNQTVADNNFDAFKNLGDRGPNAQSGVSFIHPKTGVLFYSLLNLNAVACWKTSNKEYTMKNQGRIYMNENTMVYPTDIKVDYDDNLWILSNRMPLWMYGKLDFNDVNFRVFSAPVVDAISHTACDITPRTDILDKFLKSNSTSSMSGEITARSLQASAASSLNVDVAAIFLLCWFISFGILN